jgi:hypothetical protein
VTGYQLDGNEVYRLDDLSYGESNHQKVAHSLRKESVKISFWIVPKRRFPGKTEVTDDGTPPGNSASSPKVSS